MYKKVVTRFAPSPTGFLHVGHLRTALYSFALARHYQGKFILRIEDTDKKREKEGSVENIIKTLEVFKIYFDEGPGTGGPNSPYIQSERLGIYKKKSEELIKKGYAYYCFCPPERIVALREKQIARKEQPMYDRKCRSIPIAEAQKRIENGEKYVVRLKIPDNRELKVHDEILGDIKWNTSVVDDQVLLKTDGYPTYHLAVVVDDVLMGITHITRGFEWLSSVPKHLLLFEAFGYPVPVMAHLPLILDPKGGKLSKRKGSVSTEEFLKEGYLPEALLNFIMLLGWSPPLKAGFGEKERELFSLNEFVKIFELKDLNKANPVFNREKLSWFNQKYIQSRSAGNLLTDFLKWMDQYFDDEGFKQLVKEKGDEYLKNILALVQPRVKTLAEICGQIEFFYKFKAQIELNSHKQTKHMTREAINNILSGFLKELDKKKPDLSNWNHEEWEQYVRTLAEKEGQKAGSVFMMFRLLLTQSEYSPPLYEIMQVLGKKEIEERISSYK